MNVLTVVERLAIHTKKLDIHLLPELVNDPLWNCVSQHLVFNQPLNIRPIRKNSEGSQKKQLIWQRIINKLMITKRNGGKRDLATRVFVDALDEVERKSKLPGVVLLIKAFHNSLILEDVRSMRFGSTKVHKLVCNTPTKMINTSLKLLLKLYDKGRMNKKGYLLLAEEWIACANGDSKSVALTKKKLCMTLASNANS